MKKMCLLFLVLILVILALLVNPLKINATFEDRINEQAEEVSETTDNSSTRSIPGGEDTHGEEWYNLSDDNPILTKSADYSAMLEMLQYLKPGDIIYETNGSPIGDMTKHIAIVYDIVWSADYNQYYVAIIEAYLGGVGFGIMTPNRLEEKDVIIYRLTNASESQIQGALSFIEDQLGKPYRFHFSKSDDYYSEDWYCSELVWAAFHHQGIDLDWDDNESVGTCILPITLASYEHLTTILHYTDDEDEDRYRTTITNNGATGHTYTCDGDTYTEEHDYEIYNFCYEKCRACGYERQAVAHEYTNSYTLIDSTDHYAYCECGDYVEESHNLIVDEFTSVEHTLKCTDCDYSVTSEHDMSITKIPLSSTEHGCKCIDCNYVDESTVEPHSFNSWVSVNTTTHQSACDGCDARGTTTAPHAFVPVKGSLLNVVCVDCGYTKRKDSDFGNVILSITKVSANGSYILPDGTIMLVDEDIEAYLNGTLVFYDKDNVPQVQ